MPRGLTVVFAIACGIVVANLYYAQPLIGPIAASLGLSHAAAGLIVTLTQIGYGLGLVFIVPLGDLLENRRLVVTLLALVALALVGAALSGQAWMFLVASLLIGLGSVAAQVLVPFAAHLAPEETRGQVVGNVMSGLLLGIMLARPVASLVTEFTSWHIIFALSAVGMLVTALLLWRLLPLRAPDARLPYGALIASMGSLALHTPILQRRALYQACLFGAFSLFWTTVPLYLAGPYFGLSQGGIALFAFAGAAGAVATPLAGRLADRGIIRPATAGAMLLVGVAFVMTLLVPGGHDGALAVLVLAAILLDFGVAANLTVGQRAIYALDAQNRSRLNGIYMASFFVGGAICSAAGAWAFDRGGWTWSALGGLALPLLALAAFATEKRRP